MTESAAQVTALYRMYGHDGSLLYVGITCDIGSRFSAHGQEKPWWTEVARIDVSQHPCREDALAVERLEIQSLRPAWNIVHNRGRSHSTPDKWALVYAERDRKVRVLVESGLDAYDIQRGLSTSQSNIIYSLERLLEAGEISHIPPRRHPGSPRNRHDSVQRAQATEVLAAAGLSCELGLV